jgi:HAE1 family hydrophobic/amphiphilic exporter-1
VRSEALRNTPIQTSSGQIVQLSDIATFLRLYREDADSVSRYNGEESVLLEITKAKSANSVTVCRAVEDILAQYEGDSLHFKIISSESDDIVDTLLEVVKTLVIGVLLTMLVLFLFFGDGKACLIVAVSMPLSVLLAMILLIQKGVAFDLMSGTALVIAIGMIVDNSIVVLESCFSANEQGLDFQEAAVQGTGQVLMSVFAGTLTTIVVYIPLALASGLSGQMVAPLSWTIALVMISSLLCAVTVVPMIFVFIKPTVKQELPINRLLCVLLRPLPPGLRPWICQTMLHRGRP